MRRPSVARAGRDARGHGRRGGRLHGPAAGKRLRRERQLGVPAARRRLPGAARRLATGRGPECRGRVRVARRSCRPLPPEGDARRDGRARGLGRRVSRPRRPRGTDAAAGAVVAALGHRRSGAQRRPGQVDPGHRPGRPVRQARGRGGRGLVPRRGAEGVEVARPGLGAAAGLADRPRRQRPPRQRQARADHRQRRHRRARQHPPTDGAGGGLVPDPRQRPSAAGRSGVRLLARGGTGAARGAGFRPRRPHEHAGAARRGRSPRQPHGPGAEHGAGRLRRNREGCDHRPARRRFGTGAGCRRQLSRHDRRLRGGRGRAAHHDARGCPGGRRRRWPHARWPSAKNRPRVRLAEQRRLPRRPRGSPPAGRGRSRADPDRGGAARHADRPPRIARTEGDARATRGLRRQDPAVFSVPATRSRRGRQRRDPGGQERGRVSADRQSRRSGRRVAGGRDRDGAAKGRLPRRGGGARVERAGDPAGR